MSNKKTIALCMSGQLRCHNKITHIWIENFINQVKSNYDVTVFFYVGNDKYFSDTWESIYEEYRAHNTPVIVQTEVDRDFREELPYIFELTPSGLKNGHNQLIREHYYMDKVIELKKSYERDNSMIFDYVVRTRPDVLPEKFNESLLDLVDDKLCISDHDHHGYINGRFTICSSKLSDIVFNIVANYKNTIKNLEEPKVIAPNIERGVKYFAGEYVWSSHLMTLSIETKLIPFKVYLVRDYDVCFDKQSQGIIYLNGYPIQSFKADEKKIPIEIINR